MKKCLSLILAVLLVISLSLPAFSAPEGETITLPMESTAFSYDFSKGEKQISDFDIEINNIYTGVKMFFMAESKTHTLDFKLIEKESGKVTFANTFSMLEGVNQEFCITSDNLEAGKKYYLELSEPSEKNAVGTFKIGISIGDEAMYAELKRYEIFVGDENGDLRLDEGLTRAEFCKMIITEMGMDIVELDKASQSFTDVSLEHWAIGEINLAYGLGIINGVGEGSFAPDDKIIYQDMLKMVVSALGYAPEAEKKGGYPHGYIMQANILGLTEDFASGDNTTREHAANCLYKALDIPHMVQTVYGADPKYAVLDGKEGTDFRCFRGELEEVLEYKAKEEK